MGWDGVEYRITEGVLSVCELAGYRTRGLALVVSKPEA